MRALGFHPRSASAVALFAAGACAAQAQVVLRSDAPQVDGNFGGAVALTGDHLFVGAPGENAVHVFDRATLTRIDTLTPHDPEYVSFGRSLAAIGSKLVVGARVVQDNMSFGRADGFDVPTGQREYGLFPGPASLEAWGTVAASSEHGFVVGRGINQGEGVLGVYHPETFLGQRVLASASPVGATNYGVSLAVSGETAIAGAIPPGFPGSVYLYNMTTGDEIDSFIAPDGVADDQFGRAVAIDGERAVVGVPRFGGIFNGAICIFDLAGEDDPILVRPDGSLTDRLGLSVALAGRIIAAGSEDDDGRPGRVHLIDALNGRQLTTIQPAESSDEDGFGGSIAMDDSTLVITAPNNDDLAENAGAVYVYTFSEGALLADVDSSGVIDATDLAVLLAAWGGDAIVVDFNSDGVVDAADLAIMLAAWGPIGP